MKEKNIKQLKPYYGTLTENIASYSRAMRKAKALQEWLRENIPFNIVGKYSFDVGLGEGCTRCFIYLEESEDSTITLLKWLPELKKQRFVIEKFWREDSGHFSYKAERKYNPYGCTSYIIFFEESANIDGCKITKKRKMKTIFVTDCEKDRIL